MYEGNPVKPITTSKTNSSFSYPWSIRFTNSKDVIELTAVSTSYFEVTESNANDKIVTYAAKENDGLFIVETKINLGSKYTSFYHEVYYYLDSPKVFTYKQEKFNLSDEIFYWVIFNLMLITFFVSILVWITHKHEIRPKTKITE